MTLATHEILIYILLGMALIILIVWGISEIQIRVWTRGIDKFLSKKSKKVKKQEDEEIDQN